MEKKLRPAHEVIVEQIAVHCSNAKAVGEDIKDGRSRLRISVIDLEMGRGSEIGALCALLRVLESMIIPEDKLGWVVDQLSKINYRHAVLSGTIISLEERRSPSGGQKVAAESEDVAAHHVS